MRSRTATRLPLWRAFCAGDLLHFLSRDKEYLIQDRDPGVPAAVPSTRSAHYTLLSAEDKATLKSEVD